MAAHAPDVATPPMLLITVTGSLALLVIWGIWAFNRLVRSRNRTRAAWSDIDVQLQRRHDLVPQLVDAVRAYAGYERATLTAVTELRSRSEQASKLAEKAQIEDELEKGLQRLVALAEAYPDLKASENFLKLQTELAAVEDHLQYARRFYNGAVRDLNTLIETFPDLFIARTFGFSAAEFFAGSQGSETPPHVDMTS
jgi:LemA protein